MGLGCAACDVFSGRICLHKLHRPLAERVSLFPAVIRQISTEFSSGFVHYLRREFHYALGLTSHEFFPHVT